MSLYSKGDHVKFEVVDDRSGESEWLRLLVESSNDESGTVFGGLDSQPIVITDMKLGQELAVGYDKIRGKTKICQLAHLRNLNGFTERSPLGNVEPEARCLAGDRSRTPRQQVQSSLLAGPPGSVMRGVPRRLARALEALGEPDFFH